MERAENLVVIARLAGGPVARATAQALLEQEGPAVLAGLARLCQAEAESARQLGAAAASLVALALSYAAQAGALDALAAALAADALRALRAPSAA